MALDFQGHQHTSSSSALQDGLARPDRGPMDVGPAGPLPSIERHPNSMERLGWVVLLGCVF